MRVLNRIFQAVRYRKAMGCIKESSVVCDLGCGSEALFLKKISGRIKNGVGLDLEAGGGCSNLKFVRHNLDDPLPLDDGTFDHVTLIAVIEHLKRPEDTVKEAYRILKKGGSIVITMPSPFADRILNLLLRTPFFDDEEDATLHTSIKVNECCSILERCGFTAVDVKKFELGLNNLITAKKPTLTSGIISARTPVPRC